MARHAVSALLACLLAGCTAAGVRQGIYDGLVWQHCLERPGQQGCGGARETYDAYVQARAQLLERHNAKGCTN